MRTTPGSTAQINRRASLIGAGAGMAAGAALGTAYAHVAAAPDYTLRIAPLKLGLAPRRAVDTFGYNGTVPGGALEGSAP